MSPYNHPGCAFGDEVAPSLDVITSGVSLAVCLALLGFYAVNLSSMRFLRAMGMISILLFFIHNLLIIIWTGALNACMTLDDLNSGIHIADSWFATLSTLSLFMAVLWPLCTRVYRHFDRSSSLMKGLNIGFCVALLCFALGSLCYDTVIKTHLRTSPNAVVSGGILGLALYWVFLFAAVYAGLSMSIAVFKKSRRDSDRIGWTIAWIVLLSLFLCGLALITNVPHAVTMRGGSSAGPAVISIVSKVMQLLSYIALICLAVKPLVRDANVDASKSQPDVGQELQQVPNYSSSGADRSSWYSGA